MIQSIEYKCINAIGNSLDLDKMLTEVISTFVQLSGAITGAYIIATPHPTKIITIGREFALPNTLSLKIDGYEIFPIAQAEYLLDIPIDDEHFLFLFSHNIDLDIIGNMFSNFRIKLGNAISACRSVEELHTKNALLSNQVIEEKSINKINEKLIVEQSRMAIMGEMIGMIAHQWRQPITIIGMVANNLILDINLGESVNEKLLDDLELIDKQVHYLSQTIDDFRNFFRSNKLPQTFTSLQISKEIVTIIGKSLEEHKITLSFTGDMESSFVSHKNELLQVFLNILSNSKDAFNEQDTEIPRITFHSKVEGNLIQFFIQDNAGGIPPDIIGHIFEPYFSTKNAKNGTGLGLYMSAIIIEKHLGGTISVSSDHLGSLFSITLPINPNKDSNSVY